MQIALIILACMFSGMLLGMRLRYVIPEHHTQADSKDILLAAAGMMATLVALIIGLLVNSAKDTYDVASAGITEAGTKAITLDYFLSSYGPEAKEAREQLRRALAVGIEHVWPSESSQPAVFEKLKDAPEMTDVYNSIRALSPQKNESREYLKAQALRLCDEVMQSRWLLIEQSQNDLPRVFLIVLTFWLTVLFAQFGLLTPPNLTAVTALFICALSMSSAIFLILELNHPLQGNIKVSSAPLYKALSVLGK
ncbi:MAG: bestrophin-like domain [Methylobacter sp.]